MEQTIGQKIRQLRESKDLTQQQLAAECGVTKDHISKIERSKVDARVKTLQKLAEGLGISASELF